VLALALRPLRRLHPLVNLVLAMSAMLPLVLPAFVHGTTDLEANWMLRITCSFVAGILTSLAVRGVEDARWREQCGLFLSGSSIMLALVVFYWAEWRSGLEAAAGQPVGMYCLVAVGLWPPLIAGLALTDRGPARLLSSSPLVYGGQVSYCLYLAHWVVRDAGMALLWHDPNAVWIVTPLVGLAAPLLVFASFLLAVALHHGVEKPAHRRLVALLPARRAGATESSAERGTRPEHATGPAAPVGVPQQRGPWTGAAAPARVRQPAAHAARPAVMPLPTAPMMPALQVSAGRPLTVPAPSPHRAA